jgi:hypothetical protein
VERQGAGAGGFIKGWALSYAQALRPADDPIQEMSKANTHDDNEDALSCMSTFNAPASNERLGVTRSDIFGIYIGKRYARGSGRDVLDGYECYEYVE